MLEVGAYPDVVARSCENIRGLQTAVSVHIERVQEFIRTKLDHG